MPTYAFALTTSQRRVIFSKPENAGVLMDILFRYRDEGQYLLHGFAILPVQVHLLLTPLRQGTVERCMQRIRDEFAHRVRQRIPGELWQAWVIDHRVRNPEDFEVQLEKIAALPEQRKLREFAFVHTRHLDRMDAMPASWLDTSPATETREAPTAAADRWAAKNPLPVCTSPAKDAAAPAPGTSPTPRGDN